MSQSEIEPMLCGVPLKFTKSQVHNHTSSLFIATIPQRAYIHTYSQKLRVKIFQCIYMMSCKSRKPFWFEVVLPPRTYVNAFGSHSHLSYVPHIERDLMIQSSTKLLVIFDFVYCNKPLLRFPQPLTAVPSLIRNCSS